MEEFDTETDDNAMAESDENSVSDGNEKFTIKVQKVTNGKWKLHNAKRSFKKEWMEVFPWVEEHPDDSKFAICRACNKKFRAHRGILEAHQKTKIHLKNLSGCDDIDDDDEPEEKLVPKPNIPTHPGMEQMLTDPMGFLSESSAEANRQAITNLIDKLVEKYHENRLVNLSIQNQAMMELHAERASMLRAEKQRTYERHVHQQTNKQRELEVRLRFMQHQYETKIHAMEGERDVKMKAIEQQLLFARQEYEKKMKLLDQQLQFMK